MCFLELSEELSSVSKHEFESATANKPSVFESFKLYRFYMLSLMNRLVSVKIWRCRGKKNVDQTKLTGTDLDIRC